MATKQTAVDWFIEQLEQKGDSWVNVSIGRMQISIKEEEYIDLINQAKVMDKEQKKDAYKNGALTEFLKISELKDSEQYYKETYNNQDNDKI